MLLGGLTERQKPAYSGPDTPVTAGEGLCMDLHSATRQIEASSAILVSHPQTCFAWGLLLLRRSIGWSIIGEGEGGCEVAEPGVLEFAVWRRNRELERKNRA